MLFKSHPSLNQVANFENFRSVTDGHDDNDLVQGFGGTETHTQMSETITDIQGAIPYQLNQHLVPRKGSESETYQIGRQIAIGILAAAGVCLLSLLAIAAIKRFQRYRLRREVRLLEATVSKSQMSVPFRFTGDSWPRLEESAIEGTGAVRRTIVNAPDETGHSDLTRGLDGTNDGWTQWILQRRASQVSF